MDDGSAPTSRWAMAWSGPSIGPTRSALTRSRSSPTTRPPGGAAPNHRPRRRPSGRGSTRSTSRRSPIHAPYLINLAGPEETLLRAVRRRPGPGAAGGARLQRAIRQRPHRLTSRSRGRGRASARLADGLRLVLAEVDDGRRRRPMLVLENSAGSGFGIGTNVAELAAIADAVAARGVAPRRVGFCLDTAHAWAAGIDLGRPDAIDAFLADFDALIGLDRLVMLHLNDSQVRAGVPAGPSRAPRGRADRGRGPARISWPPVAGHATYYLETPGMDEGYDAVNVPAPTTSPRADRWPTCRPRRWTCGAAARTGPHRSDRGRPSAGRRGGRSR